MARRFFPVTMLFSGIVFFAACGYGWQGQGNPWKAQGIEKVFVQTLANDTLRPGVEVMFTEALLKEFARGKKIRIVASEAEADAVVDGRVQTVETTMNVPATVGSISNDPKAQDLKDMVIASDYSAMAAIFVRLVRKKDSRVLWSQSFSRSKIYPGGNRFGLQGNTSSLINSSQEQLALGEIAQFLAGDAYDVMMTAF